MFPNQIYINRNISLKIWSTETKVKDPHSEDRFFLCLIEHKHINLTTFILSGERNTEK